MRSGGAGALCAGPVAKRSCIDDEVVAGPTALPGAHLPCGYAPLASLPPGAQLPSGNARQAALPPARSAALDAGFTCTKEHTRGQPPEGYSVLVQVEIQMRNRRPCRTLLMWLWLRPVRQSIHDLAV